LTAELAETHAALVAVARAGRSEHASIRQIAEAVGLSRPRVYELLNHTTRPLQTVEPMNLGSTCG
jgi:DNA-binding phage protein